jgi:hypothetical protein
MPILTEQERLLVNEDDLASDSGTYALGSAGSWTTFHDYGNITLASDSILLVKCDAEVPAATGKFRLKIGTTVVYVSDLTTSYVTHGVILFLAAGTYDVKFEYIASNSANIKNFAAGLCKFNDQQTRFLGAYSSSIALTVANRVTPAGPLTYATFLVHCTAVTPSGVTNFEDIGDNLTNGVSITIDGIQVSWNERLQDSSSGVDNAFARLSLPYSVGTQHTVAISKRNANTTVEISVIACPWILPYSLFQPLTLSFSQGSTFYSSLEPLFMDPTKFVGVGAVRGISWGSASDYYNSQTGTSLIQYSVTMDVLDVTMTMFFYGFGGCIGYIAVDVR